MARWTGVVGNSSIGTNSAIQGVAQGLYEESSVQMGPLGSKREMEDGRV